MEVMPTRTRNRHVSVWLTDAELAHLRKQATAAGLGIDPFLRSLILGVQLRPRPPDTYATLLRELSAIGNNINQLSVKANTLGFVDAPMLKREAQRWHKFQADIERVFLRPEKSEMKWQ